LPYKGEKAWKTSVRVAEGCQLARRKQNIQNRTYIIIINVTIKIYNLQNYTKAYKIHNHAYDDKKLNQKNMKEYDKRRRHIISKIHMIYISYTYIRHLFT